MYNFYKVLEKLVNQQVFEFIYPSLSCHQFGFIPGRSCLQQLLLYMHELVSANNNQDADVIYLGYHKAFDSVPHNELLLKLWKHGITGDLWSWFKAYLTARRQNVRVCNHTSEYLPIISGVPQETLLGPLLYLLYINDMFDLFTVAKPFTFADDTKLLIT